MGLHCYLFDETRLYLSVSHLYFKIDQVYFPVNSFTIRLHEGNEKHNRLKAEIDSIMQQALFLF